MTDRFVWIVMHWDENCNCICIGCNYEPGEVLAVYDNEKSAIKYVENLLQKEYDGVVYSKAGYKWKIWEVGSEFYECRRKKVKV